MSWKRSGLAIEWQNLFAKARLAKSSWAKNSQMRARVSAGKLSNLKDDIFADLIGVLGERGKEKCWRD